LITIDEEKGIVTFNDGKNNSVFNIGSQEAFKIISRAYLRAGWDSKYVYSFSWLGRPIIQLPDDLIRLQEVIYSIKPDVIIEIGVAHGGSLIFSASLCKAIGKGRVIGIDIEIRKHNRVEIENHFLAESITLIEGNSIEESTIQEVRNLLNPNEKVLIFLDGCHTKDHVLEELRLYSKFVSIGSYIVAMDGIMKDLKGAPRSSEDWEWNNPTSAAKEFVNENTNFRIMEPIREFNEGIITERYPTYWPDAFVKRVK